MNDQEQSRENKLKNLISLGLNPYLHEKFERTHNCASFTKQYDKFDREFLHSCPDIVKIAGRIMAIRQTFGVIMDFSGEAQFYLNKKTVEPELFEIFKRQVDIGDIIGIIGKQMKTNTNKITINISKFVILAKALEPLPEKFHGLVNEELRARKRYLDLIVNHDSLSTFITRIKIVNLIRQYMNSINFLEVETPILSKTLVDAAAKPSITYHNTLNQQYYLRIAPEIALKKLIVGGFEKIYEIGHVFRNEGMDPMHNPEFTTMEVYQAYVGLDEMMLFCENIFKFLADKLNLKQLNYKGFLIDFSQPFKKISMVDFINQECNIDFNMIDDLQAIELAKKHNIILSAHQKTKGHIISEFFEKYCEEKCLQPTFITSYPVDISPLAKKEKNNQNFTRRFELFICKKEYANAFSELNDPNDQLESFNQQIKEKKLGNQEANEIDLEFIDALKYGLPPTGGIGIGIDRLVMLFTNKESIRDVLFFPNMRDK